MALKTAAESAAATSRPCVSAMGISLFRSSSPSYGSLTWLIPLATTECSNPCTSSTTSPA